MLARQKTSPAPWFPVTCKQWLLFRFGADNRDDPTALADGQNLIGLDLLKLFDLLRGRPLYFDEIDDLRFPQVEVQTQVALRHNAGAAVDFICLCMLAGHDADASADGGAIALCADQLDLDPTLLVATVVAKERRRVVHIQN